MNGELHTKDEDCTLDENGMCIYCGVWHGDPCWICGKRGYHAENCLLAMPGETVGDADW